MFIVSSYTLAVVFCVVTMLCWGSWGNTQKLASKSWRYELYYWDYIIGILLFSLLIGFTLGSFGDKGVPFIENLSQVSQLGVVSALVGGIIFNAANILLTAAVSISGLAIAWPIGLGIALVLGVLLNYFVLNDVNKGDPLLLFLGVAFVLFSVICNGLATGKNAGKSGRGLNKKGLTFTIVSGFLMGMFYPFVAYAMDLVNFETPEPGKATPYVAFFLCALGAFLSNFVFNTIAMRHPVSGEPVTYKQYFDGKFPTHLVGVLGGCVWGLGTVFSYISSGKAGASISYALGQGSPMIAAMWGIFIWKEFKGGNKTVNAFLTTMFISFILGLALIVMAGN